MAHVKLGTDEKKKVYILGGLLLVAGVVYYFNSSGSSETYTPPTNTSARPPTITGPKPAQTSTTRSSRPNDRSVREFRPTLKPRKAGEGPDPTSIDPSLRMDLLAKVQTVSTEGAHRNIFEFSQAPPAEAAKPAAAKPKVPSPIVPVTTQTAQTTTPTEPPAPKAPPVPLKFYGYISAANQPGKRAFFVEGEDIHVVTEGDVVKQRYKIVRIGVNSVVVEDTQFKSQQTLPLEEQPG